MEKKSGNGYNAWLISLWINIWAKFLNIIVLVAEEWCVNFFLQFSHFIMCLNKNAQY